MGVVNVTPDSFSDGGAYFEPAVAIAHGFELAREGAAIIDIGGESTRPGAESVPAADELARVLPVLRGLSDAGVVLSVDTCKTEVMRAALEHGADMINDVNAFRASGALEAVAPSNAGLCFMHMQGEPRTMQLAPHYDDVVNEVAAFLRSRAQAAEQAGVTRNRIVVDPGFGFGKMLRHNLDLLRRLGEIAGLGYPVLAGLSRKSTLGTITGLPAGERTYASVAAALLAVVNGARIVRVHDVAATRDALAVFEAMHAGA
ncbi:MAG: dihydropteroate synthase [Betaproteobacteria bacterium]|nr:dihydropteroate synthase [Betaproteobacteria bacterium]